MGLFSVHMLLFAVVCATVALGGSARSSAGYNYGPYGQRTPPAVAANGSGRRNGQVAGVDTPRDIDQTKGVQPQDKIKSAGPAMSAWGIIAIILTLCLSVMGVYYFTLFYPILCKKERKYDVMDLGSQ